LKEDFQLVMPDVLMTMDHTGPIIATHTGKGAYAIIYYEKQGI